MAALTWERAKDPDEIIDYLMDWSDELDADVITSSEWIVPVGITADDTTIFTNTTAKIWLSGGTAGENYAFVNRVTTAAGRTLDRTAKLRVRVR